MPRAAAALLYSGVTAARSVGDGLDASLKLREPIAEGAKLGAQLFVCGPMFTAEGGHGTEFVQQLPRRDSQDTVKAQLRAHSQDAGGSPPAGARAQGRAASTASRRFSKRAGATGMLYDRLDLLLVRAVSEEAHAQHLPLAIHTGDARDVADAVEIGAASRGTRFVARRDPRPPAGTHGARGRLSRPDARRGAKPTRIFFGGEAGRAGQFAGAAGRAGAPAQGHARVRGFRQGRRRRQGASFRSRRSNSARANLLRAWKAGVPLVMGTDSGNPLVFHGPSLHHELQLWVQAGIPAAVALQAATGNAAKLLREPRTASAASARAWTPTCCWWTAIRFRTSAPRNAFRWWCSKANGFAGPHCSIRSSGCEIADLVHH